VKETFGALQWLQVGNTIHKLAQRCCIKRLKRSSYEQGQERTETMRVEGRANEGEGEAHRGGMRKQSNHTVDRRDSCDYSAEKDSLTSEGAEVPDDGYGTAEADWNLLLGTYIQS